MNWKILVGRRENRLELMHYSIEREALRDRDVLSVQEFSNVKVHQRERHAVSIIATSTSTTSSDSTLCFIGRVAHHITDGKNKYRPALEYYRHLPRSKCVL